MQPQLEDSWKEALEKTFQQEYMRELSRFLRQEQKARRIFYSPAKLIFNALNSTLLNQIKAVIIGLMLKKPASAGRKCPVAHHS